MRIEKTFKFYAAHRNQSLEGKCSNLHGHRYGVTVVLEPERTRAGITMLFEDIDQAIEPIIARYDHGCLIDENDPALSSLSRIENNSGEPMKLIRMDGETSAENPAARLFEEIKVTGLPLVEIRLQETDSSVVIYDVMDDFLKGTE